MCSMMSTKCADNVWLRSAGEITITAEAGQDGAAHGITVSRQHEVTKQPLTMGSTEYHQKCTVIITGTSIQAVHELCSRDSDPANAAKLYYFSNMVKFAEQKSVPVQYPDYTPAAQETGQGNEDAMMEGELMGPEQIMEAMAQNGVAPQDNACHTVFNKRGQQQQHPQQPLTQGSRATMLSTATRAHRATTRPPSATYRPPGQLPGPPHIADATISEAVLSTCIHIHMQQPAWLGNGRCMGASCRAWLPMW